MMDFTITILNIASSIFLLGSLFYFIKNHSQLVKDGSWGGVAVLGIAKFSILGLITDLSIQLVSESLKVVNPVMFKNCIGLLILIGVYYIFRNTAKQLIIKVPSGYKETIAIIYNIPSAKILPQNIFTLNYEIKMRDESIYLTRTNKLFYSDVPISIRMDGSGEVPEFKVFKMLSKNKDPFDQNKQDILINIISFKPQHEIEMKKKLEEVKTKYNFLF